MISRGKKRTWFRRLSARKERALPPRVTDCAEDDDRGGKRRKRKVSPHPPVPCSSSSSSAAVVVVVVVVVAAVAAAAAPETLDSVALVVVTQWHPNVRKALWLLRLSSYSWSWSQFRLLMTAVAGA